ncbi:polyhydroxybutyrate depolymerase [Lutibacter oricola]|uniref:Polyhydroxybutyrate depolymerase n=1 Tax=Lutibacter oricola TaxID=762486 RepID=A0A1H2SP87_9FLAO|nr:PHB depolymerase family esterase [Lutibacter oricola]SDW33265.1 polyhydroxybutyrate depolymerase [Lutibacter oricola]
MKTKLILSLTICILALSVNAQTRFVKVNDTIRQFTVYKPNKIDSTKKVPLLLNFHGSGMTALEQMFYTNTNTLAEDIEIVVAYPQGINNDWNVGFEQDYDTGTKDVEFIKVLIEKLVKNYSIDKNRIYATGLSRGGFFIQRLVAELPNQIKGFVAVGAPMPVEVKNRMQSNEPVKAMFVHGTADYIVKMDGKENAYVSHSECIDYWKKRNNATDKAKIETINTVEDETSVTIKNYDSVTEILIENGGHTWPGTDSFNVGFPLGKTTQDINFNNILANFINN